MAISDYEKLLSEARQLPVEERRRLASALLVEDTAVVNSASALVASLLALDPLEPAVWDEMERVIEEGCEQIDFRDW